MNKPHGVYGLEGENDLGNVKAGPLFGHVIVGHEVDEVTAGHVVHHHIEVLVVLEGKMELDDPLGVGVSHDVSLLPEKCTVTSFYLKKKFLF